MRPQDDLFRHVNGAWLTKTEIPADKASYGAFDILFDKAQADLRAIVEEASKATTKTPGSEAQKIGDFYESFMNEAARRRARHHAAQVRAGRDRRVQDQNRPRQAIRALLQTQSDQSDRRLCRRRRAAADDDILYVYQGGLGLPDRDYYLKNDDKLKEYREKYVGFVSNILGHGRRRCTRQSPPARSSCSKRVSRAPTGPTSRTAMR